MTSHILIGMKKNNPGNTKLTPQDVIVIRWLCANTSLTRSVIGQLFDVQRQTVNAIVHRDSWKNVLIESRTPGDDRKHFNVGSAHGMAKLTEEDVVVIRWLASVGCSVADLARVHGVHYLTVNQVLNRKSWTHVPENHGSRSVVSMVTPSKRLASTPAREETK